MVGFRSSSRFASFAIMQLLSLCCCLLCGSLRSRLRFLGERRIVLEHVEGSVYHLVVAVDILRPCLLVEDVVYDAAVDIAVEQSVRLLYHQVAPLESVLVGECGELVHEVLFLQLVSQFHHLLIRVQLDAVVVGIYEGELQDESAHARLFQV